MEKPFCPWRLGAVCCTGACIRRKNFFQRRVRREDGWAKTLSLQGIQGSAAQSGAAEKSYDGFRQDRVWLRNGWIYVNLRNNLSERIGAALRRGQRSGGVVRFFAGGMAGFVRNGRKIKKRRAEWRDGLSIK